MIRAIAVWLSQWRRTREVRRIIRVINRFVRDNWRQPDQHNGLPGLETRSWRRGHLIIRCDRSSEGESIIIVEPRHGFAREVVSWSNKFYDGGILGIHDIDILPGITLGYIRSQLETN